MFQTTFFRSIISSTFTNTPKIGTSKNLKSLIVKGFDKTLAVMFLLEIFGLKLVTKYLRSDFLKVFY